MAGAAITPSQGRDTEFDTIDVASISVRQASLLAGFALLLMTGLAVFANFVVLGGSSPKGTPLKQQPLF